MAFLGVRDGLRRFLRPRRESDFQDDVSELLTHRAQKKIIATMTCCIAIYAISHVAATNDSLANRMMGSRLGALTRRAKAPHGDRECHELR